MRESDVAVESAGVRLAGTLVRPAVPKGVIIFVHGSGPLDRNENTRGQKLEVFNTLAVALAEAGYASIRYDKRGVGASGGSYKMHGYDDLVGDIDAWVHFAAGTGCGPVWLCGHSEGTLLSAKVARDGADVAGLLLLCPFVTDGTTILRRQAEVSEEFVAQMPGIGGRIARGVSRLIGGPRKSQDTLVRRVLESDKPVVWAMGRRMGIRWLRDFLSWDFAAIYRGLDVPVLLIVAGKDVQCPPEDGAAIAGLVPRASLREHADLTHLLRRSELPAGLADYRAQLKRPIDPCVGQDMVAWLDSQVLRD